ncbi:MAG: PaaI family thioesterase [Rhodospirillales bacterium]|nr:PaaI family thioesterase [Rhodospirillales bacterium]
MDDTASNPPEGFIPFPVDFGFVGLIGPLYAMPGDAQARFGFRVMEKHLNPAGICHGGMTMAVADMAVGFAALTASKVRVFPPSINNTFDFLAPAQLGDWLETRVTFVNPTRSMAFADGIMHCDEKPILRFNGICKFPRPDDSRFAGQEKFNKLIEIFNSGSGD